MTAVERSQPTPRYFLTLKEAAGILQVSPQYLKLIANGKRLKTAPRVVKLGRMYRFPRDEFFAWINANALKRKT